MRRFTKGVTGRDQTLDPRLPPGQYDAGATWPVLTAEATPAIDLAAWSLTVDGLVENPTSWSWDEIHTLPQSGYHGAIHCVTTWSKFDMQWSGVSLDTLFAIAAPLAGATHIIATSSTGYTTNCRSPTSPGTQRGSRSKPTAPL